MTSEQQFERAVHGLRAALLRLVAVQWDRVQTMQVTIARSGVNRARYDELERARFRLSRLMLAANLASRLPIPA